MKRYQGGEVVGKGYFLNLARGEFVHLDRTGTRLPTNMTGEFIKVPTIGVLIGAPVISLVYVMFLPLAGIAGGLYYLGARVRRLAFAPKTKPVKTWEDMV